MSDYVHEKVVRLPIPKEMIDKYSKIDEDDYIELIEKELAKTLGELWDSIDEKYHFKLGWSEERNYIDWCYYSTYGDESGDYGHARYLTEKELSVIKPYFDKIGYSYKDKDLRVVDYCYYNACEPPDYYKVATEDQDDSKLFIK